MKIGIIAGEISKNPAGLERYLFELISHITEDASHSYQIYVKSNTGNLARAFQGKKHVEIIGVGWGKAWKEIGLLLNAQSDVYIFTGPVGSFLFWPKKSITIVYDFAYKYITDTQKGFLGSFILDLYSRKSFYSAQKIVCLSEVTKVDLLHFFKVDADKVEVVYPGFNVLTRIGEQEIQLPNNRFFLFVGTLKERKNVLNIIKGFEYLLQKHKASDCNLVIAGKYSSTNPYYLVLTQYVNARPELKSHVQFVGHITDGQLAYLYKRAVALVYPSIIEGFGLPALEAMNMGLPVITSNISSLVEAAGDAALLVDPYSVVEIGEAMNNMLEPDVRNELIKKGFENTKRFSWDRMAQQFVTLITSL